MYDLATIIRSDNAKPTKRAPSDFLCSRSEQDIPNSKRNGRVVSPPPLTWAVDGKSDYSPVHWHPLTSLIYPSLQISYCGDENFIVSILPHELLRRVGLRGCILYHIFDRMIPVNGMVRLPTSHLTAEMLSIVKQKRLSRSLLEPGDG